MATMFTSGPSSKKLPQRAKLVVIDPYRTRHSEVSRLVSAINPGTDAALALGLMHVIINENLFDADYVSRCHYRVRGAEGSRAAVSA